MVSTRPALKKDVPRIDGILTSAVRITRRHWAVSRKDAWRIVLTNTGAVRSTSKHWAVSRKDVKEFECQEDVSSAVMSTTMPKTVSKLVVIKSVKKANPVVIITRGNLIEREGR